MRLRAADKFTLLSAPQPSKRLKATCVPKTAVPTGCMERSFDVCDSSSSMPSRPDSETERKWVTERRCKPSCLSASDRSAEHAACAERTEYRHSFSLQSSALPDNCGNQGQEASLAADIPDKSMTLPPEAKASFKFVSVNLGEPVKKIRFAWLKLSSSMG